MNNDAKNLKNEILVKLIRAFYSEDFIKNTRLIPYELRPKGYEVQYRCCIYKERAILKDRTIAGLGFTIDIDNEATSLAEYARLALDRKKPDNTSLTILDTACKGCVPSRVYVTDLCQGCVARPCVSKCRFGAININNGRAIIDPQKCKNCGMCLGVCQYQAITKLIVPCENACPVGAITKNTQGHAQIDFTQCISCGKCINACPFYAVNEKQQIIDVLKHIKAGKNVVAMIAPAIMGQFACNAEQLYGAIKTVGFTKAYEVAQGADITAKLEAKDLKERLEKGDTFMTTSCCAGYNELVDKHVNELKPFRSETKTPLYYTAEIAKTENPGSITVFFSPCVAKRQEALNNPNIDYVLTFEEIKALFIAQNIDVTQCKPAEFSYQSSKQARNFALTEGVAKSVAATWDGEPDSINPVVINGLNKQSIKDLRKYAKCAKCELGNLIEVMCCEGGCVGGNAVVNTAKISSKKIEQYAREGEAIEK